MNVFKCLTNHDISCDTSEEDTSKEEKGLKETICLPNIREPDGSSSRSLFS